MIDKKTLGQRVAIARLRVPLTQKALADKAGVTQPYVSQLEAGDIDNPGWQTIRAIESALGLRVGQLTADERPSSKAS